MTRLMLLAIALCLSACAGQSTAMASLEVSERALLIAGRVVLFYRSLPPCPRPTGSLCRDPTTERHAIISYDAADDAVSAARARLLTGGTADQAGIDLLIASLQAVATALPQPPSPPG